MPIEDYDFERIERQILGRCKGIGREEAGARDVMTALKREALRIGGEHTVPDLYAGALRVLNVAYGRWDEFNVPGMPNGSRDIAVKLFSDFIEAPKIADASLAALNFRHHTSAARNKVLSPRNGDFIRLEKVPYNPLFPGCG